MMMQRGWAGVLIFAAMTTVAGAADFGEMVEFQGGAGKVKGFLAKPEGKGPFPAIVVIHEWWGLTDWVKDNARDLARQGYVALAVDLYGGKATDDPMTAHEMMRALNQEEALADLQGGVAYLKAIDVVSKTSPVGVIGWCMGGGYSRELAQVDAAVGPTVICYGSVATNPAQIAKLKGKPVLGIFGATDRGIPVDKVKQFGEALKESGSPVEIKVYEGAGHGFMRPDAPNAKIKGHNAEAAKDAREKIAEFFAKYLKK